jgi:hypothetical protein
MQPPHSHEEFLTMLARETTILRATFPDLADALSRAHAILAEGRLFVEESGRHAMAQSSDFQRWYHVNGACQCPASTYRQEPCKHRLALRLYQRVCDALHIGAESYELAHNDYEDAAPRPPTIPPEHLVQVQGKPYVRFEGLLTLAHAQGLTALETTVTQASFDFAICQCTARFADGRTFTDIGDASPENVAKHLKPHFIRMAGTRAAARALRRALNIGACAVEELGPEGDHA